MKLILKCSFIAIIISFTLSCNKKIVGEVTIEANLEDNIIQIDNFPVPAKGIEGFNVSSYPSNFSFEKIDNAIYTLITGSDFNNSNISIKVRTKYKDEYGKDSLSTWLDIGTIDKTEADKYADFTTWNKKNTIFKMLNDFYAIEAKPTEQPITATAQTSLYHDENAVNIDYSNVSDDNLIQLEDLKPSDLVSKDAFADTIGVSGRIISYLNGSAYDIIVVKQNDGNVLNVMLHTPQFRDKRLNEEGITGKLLDGYGYTVTCNDNKMRTFLIKGKVIID